MFEGWSENGAVEINNHDTAPLGIPEQVGMALVAVLDAMGPDGRRRAVPLLPQIRRVHVCLGRFLAAPRHQHHVNRPRPARQNIAPTEVHQTQLRRHHPALEALQPLVDAAFVAQALKPI